LGAKKEKKPCHPKRSMPLRLPSSSYPSEGLDKFILALQPDDVLLLCSDSLWEMVCDASIQEIIATTVRQPTQTSATLVQAALDEGGKDTISVVIVCVKAAAGAQTAAWAD
jgi:protein phosphatase